MQPLHMQLNITHYYSGVKKLFKIIRLDIKVERSVRKHTCSADLWSEFLMTKQVDKEKYHTKVGTSF